MTISSQKKWLLFLLIGALSLSLRLLHLNQGFWMDEIITITEFARQGWLSIITEVPVPNNHIFYTLLAKLFILIFGEREWSARIPAFIMGALTPPVLYLLTRKRFSKLVSVSAGYHKNLLVLIDCSEER